MNMPSLPTLQTYPRKFQPARLTTFLAVIVALIFVAAINDARAQDSTTNTNEFLVNPYTSFGSGSLLGSGGSSGPFGTLSLGGSGGGLPLGDEGGTFTSQVTRTITTQTGNLVATFTDGDAGWYNASATDLGFYAKASGAKQAVAWQSLTTTGAGNSGTSRSLQTGDEFRMTISITRAFGQVGFSLNASGATGSSYANRTNNTRLFINTDNYGSWYVGGLSGGATSSFGYNPSENTYRNYEFRVFVTSETTAYAELWVDGSFFSRANNLTLGGSSGLNLNGYSMYGSDMWDGSSNDDGFIKNVSVRDNASVTLGTGLGGSDTFNPGVIGNGLAADSTTTVITNAVAVSGSSGSVVILDDSNTYGGNTTVSNNATVRAANNSAFGTNGAVTVNSGGRVQMSNGVTVSRNLTINGDGISTSGALQNVSGNNTWSGGISNNGNGRINSDTGLLTLSGNITNAASQTLFIGGSGNTTVSGTLTGTLASGNGALFKDGSGVLTLTNNNTGLTGLVRLLGGTISITNNNSLGSGTLEIGGLGTQAILSVGTNTSRSQTLLIQNASTNSVINVAAGSVFTVTGSLTQDGALANTTKFGKTGAGTLVLAGASGNTYNGQIQIGEGTIVAGTASSLGVNNSTTARGIDLGLNITDVSQGNNVAVFASNGVTISNSFYVAPNTSSALRTIGLSGSGSATFNNEFYMDGTLTVDAGANASDLVTMSGNILNTGGISKTNAGILVLSGSGSTFSGGVTLGSGTLRVGANSALGTGTFAINGGTFASSSSAARTITNNTTMGGNVILGDATGTGALTLSNVNLAQATRTFTVGNNTTIAGVISNGGVTAAGLTKGGAGTLTLSGNNTYSGNTTINQGVLSVAAAGNLGSATGNGAITLGGGTLATTAGMTLGSRGITVSSSSAINVTTGGLTNTAGLYGSSALSKTGAGTLSLTNTAGDYSGTITVSEGALVANTTLTSADVSVGNNAVLGGAGTLDAVTIQSGGRIAPGNSPGNLSVGSLTFDGGSGYNWELDNVAGTAGTNWDLITVGGGTGTVTFNNTSGNKLTVYITGAGTDFSNTGSYSWQIINAGTLSGFSADAFAFNYSTINGVTPTGGFSVSDSSGDLILTYTAPSTIYDVTVTSGSQTQSEAAGGFPLFTGALATVNKLGAGTLVMTNTANDYTGVTTVKAGTLQINDAVSASGNTVLGNASSAVVIGDVGAAVAAGFNFGAAVQNDRGLSIVSGNGSAGRTISTTISSGTATQAGTVVMATNATYSASSGGTLNVSGAISGAGNATISDSGTVLFSGNNSYSGTTTVSSGSTLVASNNNALGTTAGNTAVSSGGALDLAGNITTAENLSIAGTGISSGGALRNVNGANTNSGTITLSANATISAESGTTLQLNNIDNGAAARQLTFSNIGTIVVAGNFSNMDTTSTFFKLGSGSLVISNTSANTGGGQLQIGAGSVTLAAGTFSTNSGTATRGVDFGLLPGGGGGSASDTALYVNSGQTLSNSIYVAAGGGARIMGTESTSGTATFNNEIYLDSTARLTAASGGTAVFSGNFVNSGNIVKVGVGNVILSGSNTIGNLTISNGTLSVTNGSAIPSTSLLTIDGGATFAVLGSETIGRFTGSGTVSIAASQGLTSTYSSASNSFSGTLTGTGSLSKNGDGTLTLAGDSAAYSGEVILNNGTLLAGNAGAFGTGTTTINYNDGTGTRTLASADATAYTLSNNFNLYYNAFTLGQATGGTGSLTLGGAGKTFNLGSDGTETIRIVTVNGSHTIAAEMTGGSNNRFAKAGTGSITLSGANTFSGGVQLRGGTILVGNNAALGTGTFQVQFDEAGSKTIASSSSTGYTLGNSVNIYNDFTLGQTNGGTGSLTFSGAVQLGNEAGTRNITAASTTSHTFSGVIAGLRGITKLGDGTLTLSGNSANTYSGATVVSAGVLELNKTTGNAIIGNLTVNSGAKLLLSGSNQVASSGGQTVTLSGGTIQRASGVSEVFGNLNLTTASFLDFGSGSTGTMSFGTYTPSSLLTVNNFFQGNTLTFGTDLTSTIGGALFSFDNAFTSSWNSGTSTFTITAIPEPSTYVAVAGLLAVFLWPVRRRLIKDAKSILGLRAPARDRFGA